jgi:hypothetical protein
VPTIVYALTAAGLLAAVTLRAMMRVGRDQNSLLRSATVTISLFLTLSAPRYSWYLAWLVPFICFVPGIAWLYLTGASIFLYLLWLTADYPNVPLWLAAALFVPAWLFYWWDRRRQRARRLVPSC